MHNRDLINYNLGLISQVEKKILDYLEDISECLKTIKAYKAQIEKELNKDEVSSGNDM